MAKKKARLARGSKKRENKEVDHLPAQKPEEVCLYRTDPAKLLQVDDVLTYREGLVKLKLKFLWEIQDWSKRYGIDAKTRIYFELKPEV